jgi:predicted ATPase/class 3 adenylate cyclase
MNLPTGTVTFLFTDIEGSTKLAQQYPDAIPTLLARHHEILRQSVQAQNGYIFQNEGDSLAVAFHSPLDALHAASNAQLLLQQEAWTPAPIKVRMGIHTGAAKLNDSPAPTIYTGYTTLATTARVMSAGHGRQILLSGATQELIRNSLPANTELVDLGEKRLKDLLLPEHLYQLNTAGLPTSFPPLKTSEVSLTNLPSQLSTFIGREKEIEQIKQRLEKNRLVTLTGSGGVGKTRLSIQVATELLNDYPNGVWLVELAPITDPELVAQTVCAAIEIAPQANLPALQVLTDYLKQKKILLVVDNCEHLIVACAQLCETLLHACPHLRIIASSREALGVEGENVYHVPSLSLPNLHDKFEMIEQSEAVKLFMERANNAVPEFGITSTNAPVIAQICHRLDGIALAIELAASRAKLLKVEQIASRLDDVFRLLTGGSRTALPRQQTLRALIDWSYNLLSDEEKTVLRRLSVFVGGWALEAAEYACDNPNMLDLLTHLVDKSLVAVDLKHGDEPRYYLLETIRQYAREKLNESGESAILRTRHMEYFCRLVERFEPSLRGPDQIALLDGLDMELDNLRAALEWTLDHDVAEGLRLASGLHWFWHLRNHRKDGIGWLDKFLSTKAERPSLQSSETDVFDRAKALNALGFLEGNQGDIQKSMRCATECRTLCENMVGMEGIVLRARCFIPFGVVALLNGDLDQARTLAEQSLALCQACGDTFGIAEVQTNVLIGVALRSGELEAAQKVSEANLAIRRELGDKDGIAYALWNGGIVAIHQGDYERARQMFLAAIEASYEAKSDYVWGISLGNLGVTYLFQGEMDQARACYLQVTKLAQEKWSLDLKAFSICWFALYCFEHKQFRKFIELNSFLERDNLLFIYLYLVPIIQTILQKNITVARAALSEADCYRAEANGKAMTLDQALAYALEGVSE